MRYRLRTAAAIAVFLCVIPLAAGCDGSETNSATTISTTTENGLSKGTLDPDNPAPPVTRSPGADTDETSSVTETSSGSGASTSTNTSGTGESTTITTLPNPCKLLPNANISELTGMTVETGGTSGDGYCVWELRRGPATGATMNVSVGKADSDGLASNRTIPGATDIDGIGDEAVQLGTTLWVQKDGVAIDVLFTGGDYDEAKALDIRKRTAQAVIDALK